MSVYFTERRTDMPVFFRSFSGTCGICVTTNDLNFARKWGALQRSRFSSELGRPTNKIIPNFEQEAVPESEYRDKFLLYVASTFIRGN